MRTFQIIEKLGGRKAVSELLSTKKKPVSKDVIRMWCTRGTVPGNSVRVMMKVAEKRGIEIVAKDLDPITVKYEWRAVNEWVPAQ